MELSPIHYSAVAHGLELNAVALPVPESFAARVNCAVPRPSPRSSLQPHPGWPHARLRPTLRGHLPRPQVTYPISYGCDRGNALVIVVFAPESHGGLNLALVVILDILKMIWHVVSPSIVSKSYVQRADCLCYGLWSSAACAAF